MRSLIIMTFLLTSVTIVHAQGRWIAPHPADLITIDARDSSVNPTHDLPHGARLPEPLDSLDSFIVYPENARLAGIEGIVQLSVLIGYDGLVLRVKIEKSSNAIFDDAAFRAMNKMRYKPAVVNGEPARAWITQRVTFNLN